MCRDSRTASNILMAFWHTDLHSFIPSLKNRCLPGSVHTQTGGPHCGLLSPGRKWARKKVSLTARRADYSTITLPSRSVSICISLWAGIVKLPYNFAAAEQRRVSYPLRDSGILIIYTPNTSDTELLFPALTQSSVILPKALMMLG